MDVIRKSRQLSRRGQILDMHERGFTNAQIAAELGIYDCTVWQAVHEQQEAEANKGATSDAPPELPEEWASAPLTYFVYALGAGAVKIGYTESGLYSRVSELSVGSPFELIPAAVVLGRKTESPAHRALWRHRLRGEWYDAHADIWQYVEDNGVFVYHHWLEPWSDAFETGVEVEPLCDGVSAHTTAIWNGIRQAFADSNLSAREREVICMRFGLSDSCEELTLQQAAARLKVTHQRVKQIEKSALQKLSTNQSLLDFARSA